MPPLKEIMNEGVNQDFQKTNITCASENDSSELETGRAALQAPNAENNLYRQSNSDQMGLRCGAWEFQFTQEIRVCASVELWYTTKTSPNNSQNDPSSTPNSPIK